MAKPLKTLGANACPKCSKPMERRSHKQPPTKKPFYFSEWDYCPTCRHVQHYERYRVVVGTLAQRMEWRLENKMKRKPEEKPLQPIMRKMLTDLLPGLRYAVNRLRDRGQLYDAAAIERDIAIIEDGKIPPFLEQDAKGGE